MPGVEGAEREDHDECATRIRATQFRGEHGRVHGVTQRTPSRLAVFAHDFAELVVDFYCVLRSFIDQLHPSALALGRAGLRDQIGRLNDGLEGVAEVVRERAEFAGDVGGDLRFLIGDLIIG